MTKGIARDQGTYMGTNDLTGTQQFIKKAFNARVADRTVYLLLSVPLPHTTSSKKTLNLTFLDYFLLIVTIVYFDYVQHSTNCPTNITLHVLTVWQE